MFCYSGFILAQLSIYRNASNWEYMKTENNVEPSGSVKQKEKVVTTKPLPKIPLQEPTSETLFQRQVSREEHNRFPAGRFR
jgi:hypothetical protein